MISSLFLLNAVTMVTVSVAKDDTAQSLRVAACKCVPHAWVGLLQSSVRHFDLLENNEWSEESTMEIKYDFRHKIVSMHNLQTDSIIVTDFRHVSIL